MSNPPVGMDEKMMDIYTVARFVHMPGDRVEPFVKVLEMCGYEITRKEQSSDINY
jgi:hypothetical protein